METEFRITLEVVFSHTEPILKQECNALQIYSMLKKSLALLRSIFCVAITNRGHFWDEGQVECVLNEYILPNPFALFAAT